MTGGKPKLKKAYRVALGAAEDEAAKFGASISYDLRGRHPRFTVHLGEQSRQSVFSSTPRTDSQPLYMRKRVREMVAIIRESASP